jgi:hypothetical protein
MVAGRSDWAKLWWGHFRYMMFQGRGGLKPQASRVLTAWWDGNSTVESMSDTTCWGVHSRIGEFSQSKCWELERVESEVLQRTPAVGYEQHARSTTPRFHVKGGPQQGSSAGLAATLFRHIPKSKSKSTKPDDTSKCVGRCMCTCTTPFPPIT